jgi:hypothetical protein
MESPAWLSGKTAFRVVEIQGLLLESRYWHDC